MPMETRLRKPRDCPDDPGSCDPRCDCQHNLVGRSAARQCLVSRPWHIRMQRRQSRIRNRRSSLGTSIDGSNGARVIGQFAWPWSMIHSRIAGRSKECPDRVMTGSSITCKVRGQMNSSGAPKFCIVLFIFHEMSLDCEWRNRCFEFAFVEDVKAENYGRLLQYNGSSNTCGPQEKALANDQFCSKNFFS
jgi:hypothetical protein